MDLRKYLQKIVKVDIDRPLGSKHPKYKTIYLVNYGFVPGTKNDDGEEIDVYVLGVNKSVSNFEGIVIAVIHRLNDNDDKLVVAPEGVSFTDKEIIAQTYFQERYFKSEIIR